MGKFGKSKTKEEVLKGSIGLSGRIGLIVMPFNYFVPQFGAGKVDYITSHGQYANMLIFVRMKQSVRLTAFVSEPSMVEGSERT